MRGGSPGVALSALGCWEGVVRGVEIWIRERRVPSLAQLSCLTWCSAGAVRVWTTMPMIVRVLPSTAYYHNSI